MTESAHSIPFAVALRELPEDSRARILEGLRAERLLGVLMEDEIADSTGQGFGWLLGDGAGRLQIVRDDGAVVEIDATTAAARLQRRLDASVQLDAGEGAEVIEVIPPGFDPWAVIPEREAVAELTAVRWIAVLPERAEVAARWLTELATMVDGDVVLVPAGDRSLLVCDSLRFATWPRELRPVVAVVQSETTIALHAWLTRGIGADGRRRRRILPATAPDWSIVWGARPTEIMPPEGYAGLAPDTAAVWAAAQRSLIEREEFDVPPAVDQELELGARRGLVAQLLLLDPAELTTGLIVEALGLPDVVPQIVAGELDAATMPGARTAGTQSIARTLAGSMRDELRHADGSTNAIRLWVGAGLFLVAAMSIAILAGFGVFTREQTVGDPWFFVVLGILAIWCGLVGHVVGSAVARRRRRRSPVGD